MEPGESTMDHFKINYIFLEGNMKLSAPKQITWIIALILGILGVLGSLVTIPVISGALAFWLVVVGLALMLLATFVEGL